MSHIIKADVFSFGLLVLSFSCFDGVAPARKDIETAINALHGVLGMPESYLGLLTNALPLLLHSDPEKRPDLVTHFLMDDSEPCKAW